MTGLVILWDLKIVVLSNLDYLGRRYIVALKGSQRSFFWVIQQRLKCIIHLWPPQSTRLILQPQEKDFTVSCPSRTGKARPERY